MTMIDTTDKRRGPGKRESGFTLLEVLIALLVLAIGLLGLAALQTTGLRSNQMATSRTHATQLAYDITDRMRANIAGSYITNDDNVVENIVKDYELADCYDGLPDPSTGQQADEDLYNWCTAIRNMLPSGDAAVTQIRLAGLDGTAGTFDDVVTYDITVYWDEARTGANQKGCDPLNKDDLRCFKMNVTIPRPIPNA